MIFNRFCLEEYVSFGRVPFHFKGNIVNLYVMREDEEENLVTKENLKQIESVLSNIKTWDYLYTNDAEYYIDAAEDAMQESYNINNGRDLYNICNITGISCLGGTLAVHGEYFIDPEHGFLITFPYGKFLTSPTSKYDKRVSLFLSGDTDLETLYNRNDKGDPEPKKVSIEEVLELITIDNKSAEVPVFRAVNRTSSINIKLLNKILNNDRIYEIMLRNGKVYYGLFKNYQNAKDLRNDMIENIWYIDEDKKGKPNNPTVNIHFAPNIKINSYNVVFAFNHTSSGFINWGSIYPSTDINLKNETKSEYDIELNY